MPETQPRASGDTQCLLSRGSCRPDCHLNPVALERTILLGEHDAHTLNLADVRDGKVAGVSFQQAQTYCALVNADHTQRR